MQTRIDPTKPYKGLIREMPGYENSALGRTHLQQQELAAASPHPIKVASIHLKDPEQRGTLPSAVMEANALVPDASSRQSLDEARKHIENSRALLIQGDAPSASASISSARALLGTIQPGIGGLEGDGGAHRIGLRVLDGLAIAEKALTEGNVPRALDEVVGWAGG